MRSEEDTFFREGEARHTVDRFEKMQRERARSYFDVHEFEDIIDYYLNTSRLKKASDAIKLGLSQHPGSSTIQHKEAQLLIDKGHIKQSLNLLKNLASVEASNYEVFITFGTALSIAGLTDEAIQKFDQALSLNPGDKDEVASLIGFSLQDLEKYQEAVKYFRLSYKIDPTKHSCLNEMAYCYERSGQLAKAASLYKKYLEKEPFSAMVWYNLSIVYSRMDKFEDALSSIDFAYAIDDSNPSVIYTKGDILASLQNFPEAIESYLEFLEIESDNIKGIISLADCYDNLGDLKKAENYYEEAKNLDPDSPEVFFGMGMVQLKKKNYKLSRTYFKKALEKENDNAEFWYALSLVYELQDNKLEAIDAIQKALDFDPLESNYWIVLAKLLVETGDISEAIRSLNNSFSFLPHNPSIHYWLAVYSLLNNSPKEGLYHLEQGFTLDYGLHEKILKDHKWILSLSKVKIMLDKYIH